MDPEKKREVTLQVWPLSPVCWFGMVVVATLLELPIFVQRVSPLFTTPLSINPNPAPAPPVEFLEILLRLAVLLFFVVVGFLPLLIILLAVWRRWVNAGIRQTNYWVWTSIEGIVVAFSLFFVVIEILAVHTFGRVIPTLIWVIHTIAKPYKPQASRETGSLRVP